MESNVLFFCRLPNQEFFYTHLYQVNFKSWLKPGLIELLYQHILNNITQNTFYIDYSFDIVLKHNEMETYCIWVGHSFLGLFDISQSERFTLLNRGDLKDYLKSLTFDFENVKQKNCIVSDIEVHSILAINILILTNFSSGFYGP